MSLRDMKVGTQLRLGLGAIIVLVVVLVAVAWMQTTALFEQTEGLYDHPLTVRRALGDLQTDIATMHRDMKDLFLARNDQETAATLASLDLLQSDAERQFAVIRDRYLGPPADVEQAYDAFVTWGAIRAETIRLLREGRHDEGLARTMSDGAGGRQALKVSAEIESISDFSLQRGDEFYREAQAAHHALSVQLWVAAGVILALTLLISWVLLRRIREPLADLTEATGRFGGGDLRARSGYVSGNEFGMLAASFNAMADSVQAQERLDEGTADLAAVMLREDELHAFCRELLKALTERTGSQVGAVYFANSDRTAFEHFESIGLGPQARAEFSAADLEGELGVALATRQMQRVADIPADSRFTFVTVSGEFKPREILTIPVLADEDVTAVISLASIRPYAEEEIKLVRDIRDVLTARLSGVLAYREIQELARRLERQNSELEAQKRELSLQGDELTEQNTELEMQTRELDEANRLKSVFLSSMSHELRTPLNSVIALSGVLDRRLKGVISDEEYGYLEVIERNGRNLLALINDILDLSRIESGREELVASRFSLADLVGEIAEAFEPLAHENRVELVRSLPGDLPEITSDLVKCRHILQNLVGNAVKFTEDGMVEVSARQVGDEVHVAIADTGIGIAADRLQMVFEEFRQADESTSRRYGGTGLGLSIARKYAELLGGGIEVESVLGEGSTFTLRMPMVLVVPDDVGLEQVGAPASASSTVRAPAREGAGEHILLVEDSEPAIIQMTDILEAEGYRVLVARNGKEALRQVEAALPDAMILDLMMPEVDGFEVLRSIRGAERTARLPVLILTAKHVSRDELSFLTGNNIHQLIQKGDVSRSRLLKVVGEMVAPRTEAPVVSGEEPPTAGEGPADGAGRPGADHAGQAHAARAGDGRHIVLVIEDDPDSRRTARALLGGIYEVLEAEDGRAGVELARAAAPDVILMDIAMPVMDGIQALDEIRHDEALRRIPVIAVTASAMSGDRAAILAHGFDGYISKPIDEQILMATLEEVIQ